MSDAKKSIGPDRIGLMDGARHVSAVLQHLEQTLPDVAEICSIGEYIAGECY